MVFLRPEAGVWVLTGKITSRKACQTVALTLCAAWSCSLPTLSTSRRFYFSLHVSLVVTLLRERFD
jgi:hypothetical protein